MVKMLQEANKALLKLQSMLVKLKFPNLGNPHKLQVVGYTLMLFIPVY